MAVSSLFHRYTPVLLLPWAFSPFSDVSTPSCRRKTACSRRISGSVRVPAAAAILCTARILYAAAILCTARVLYAAAVQCTYRSMGVRRAVEAAPGSYVEHLIQVYGNILGFISVDSYGDYRTRS